MTISFLFIILTIVSLFLLYIGIKHRAPDVLITLFLVVIFGWVILGNMVPTNNVSTKVETYNVIHDDKACYLTLDGRMHHRYTDYVTYNFLVNKTNVQGKNIKYLNMYGGRSMKEEFEIVKE